LDHQCKGTPLLRGGLFRRLLAVRAVIGWIEVIAVTLLSAT
jgi:hypothetical protein